MRKDIKDAFLEIGTRAVRLFFLFFLLWLALIFWPDQSGKLIFLPLAFAFVYVIYKASIADSPKYTNPKIREIMKDFANDNNLHFFADVLTPSIKARFLSLSSSRYFNKKKDIIEFIYNNFTVRILNCPFYEDKKGVKWMTISEISFEKTSFPHILFVRPEVRFFNNISRYRSDIEIKPSYSKKDFRLYVTKGYQTEALQIFSSDFTEYLNDQSEGFGIEFVGNKLYIFDFREIADRDYLDNFYTVTKKVIDFVGETSDRLHNDFDALHPYYKK